MSTLSHFTESVSIIVNKNNTQTFVLAFSASSFEPHVSIKIIIPRPAKDNNNNNPVNQPDFLIEVYNT